MTAGTSCSFLSRATRPCVKTFGPQGFPTNPGLEHCAVLIPSQDFVVGTASSFCQSVSAEEEHLGATSYRAARLCIKLRSPCGKNPYID